MNLGFANFLHFNASAYKIHLYCVFKRNEYIILKSSYSAIERKKCENFMEKKPSFYWHFKPQFWYTCPKDWKPRHMNNQENILCCSCLRAALFSFHSSELLSHNKRFQERNNLNHTDNKIVRCVCGCNKNDCVWLMLKIIDPMDECKSLQRSIDWKFCFSQVASSIVWIFPFFSLIFFNHSQFKVLFMHGPDLKIYRTCICIKL